MPVRVRVPGPLRRLTGGNAEVTVEGDTVSAALTALESEYPGFHDRLYEPDGKLRQFINIYVNDEDIRFLGGETYSFQDGDEVMLIPSIAGGSI